MHPYNFFMLPYFRKKLAASAVVLFIFFSTVNAQILSGYIGSTSAEDGYKGEIRKVTIIKRRVANGKPEPNPQGSIEIIYDTKGRCISRYSTGQSTKYTYGNGYLIETTGSYISAKAIFNADNTLDEYITYNPAGQIIRSDKYTYKNGKIVGMNRTDALGKTISQWTYTTDSDGNTLIQNDTATSSYTYSPDGVLLKEYKQYHENTYSETIYNDTGDEISYKGYTYPSQAMRMLGDIPMKDITSNVNRRTDKNGRVVEIENCILEKVEEQWFDEDGNFVSSEKRTDNTIELKWNSYRYDGKLAEIQTELWKAPSEENSTGYSSLAEEYFYNNDGLLTQIIIYDETGSETEKHIYKYDDDGALYSMETVRSEIEQSEYAFYTWNDNDQIETKLTYDKNFADESSSSFFTDMEEYEYEPDGKVSKIYYTSIARLIVPDGSKPLQNASSSETDFFYDKNGLLIKERKIYKNTIETLVYRYDANGKKTQTFRLEENPDGTSEYSERFYSYEADEDCIKMTEYNSLRTKKTYSYNDKGNISAIKEYEIRYIDGTETNILTSVTEYKYN